MRNRRGFLAAAGLGAAASLTSAAGSAVAGCFRRRPRVCSTEYQIPGSTSCSGGGPDILTGPAVITTSCTLACPQSLLFQVGEIYYYHCGCWTPAPGPCPGVTSGSSYDYTNLPIDCMNATSKSNCIGAVVSSPGRMKPHLPTQTRKADGVHAELPFYLNSLAQTPPGVTGPPKLHAEAFLSGFSNPQTFSGYADTITRSKSSPTVKNRKVAGMTSAMTQDNRYVGLYDVTYDIGDQSYVICVGFELTAENPTGEIQVSSAPFKGFDYYQWVYANGNLYNVVLKK